MSTSSHKKENKNIKALFSIICLCIIALGLIVYFSTSSNNSGNDAVNEHTTIEETTQVQRAVTNVTEEEKTTKKSKKTTKKTTKAKSTSMPQGKNNMPYKSDYSYPLSESVAVGYSEELVYDETMGDYRAHPAVDFSGREDDKIVAINDGIVLNVYTDNMYGTVVEIDHGGKLVAKYCGLKSVSVKKGSSVSKGGKIGTLGVIPVEGSSAPHLHFETILNKKPVNPLNVMGKTE